MKRRTALALLLVSTLSAAASSGEGCRFLVEAEDFSHLGGWLVETQFTHKMGSAYLIAPGVGKPVADAWTLLVSPQAATCRAWVRTKDWIPEFHPGAFALSVNGVPSKTLDLARTAKVTATSFGARQMRTKADVQIDPAHAPLPLKGPLTVVYRRGETTRLDAFNAFLTSSVDEDLEVRLEVRASETIAGADAGAIATGRATVRGNSAGYVRFPVGAQLTKRFVWVTLLPERRVAWSFCPKGNLFGARAWPNGPDTNLDGGDWHYHAFDHYAYFTEPAQTWTDEELPELVLDGYARSSCEEPHGWKSDPSQKLPQALTLTWNAPIRAHEIRLAFDSNLYTNWPEAPMPKTLVKAYRLDCATGKGPWRPLVDEPANFLRHRVHTFAPATFDRLRLTVRETYGDPSARLFELRVY